jgi:3-deoxy-manno-octulosonate cytidylyltransferase (CMP-KDO synthetase)
MSRLRVMGIIPARYSSTRWEGKVLAEVDGCPLIEHAWRSLTAATTIDLAVVATDDERIARWAGANKVPWIYTSPEYRNGTERCARIASWHAADIYVNVQADQVGLEPRVIDRLVEKLASRKDWQMATPATRDGLPQARRSIDSVLVEPLVGDLAGRFWRGGNGSAGTNVLRHLGVYAYRRAPLLEYSRAEPVPEEQRLSLEQWRAIELGWSIGLVRVRSKAISYDREKKGELIVHS